MMNRRKKTKTVIHRMKHDKDISQEPEMIELKRMIRNGELDSDRAIKHTESEADNAEGDIGNKDVQNS